MKFDEDVIRRGQIGDGNSRELEDVGGRSVLGDMDRLHRRGRVVKVREFVNMFMSVSRL
jgi:hypothetical protein